MKPIKILMQYKFKSRPGRVFTWPVLKYLAVILCIVLFLFYLPVSKQFMLIEEKTGKVLYNTAVKQLDTFSVSYVHSVNKSPVEDVFDIQQDNVILLKKTIFSSFGAGIPFELEEGQVLAQKEGSIEISNINRPIEPYLLKVGTIADHTLFIHNRRIRLDSLTKPGNTVRLVVRQASVYLYLRGII